MDFLYEQFKLAFQNNSLLQGGLILGLLSVIGYKLRDFLLFAWNKIKTLTVYSVYIDDSYDGMYDEFNKWYREKYPNKFRYTEARLFIYFDMIKKGYISNINLKQFNDTNLIWYENRFIYINKQRETFSSATQRDNFYVNKYIIKGFFAKKAILKLLNEIGQFEIKVREEKNRLAIYSYSNYWYQMDKENSIMKSFDKLYLSNKKYILNILDCFKESFDNYRKLDLSHKTSMLFYGPPGTGKSSICTAIAKYMNYPLYTLNLSTIEKDSELEKCISQIPARSILLLEDIDRFLPDNNINIKYNLGTLLNCLDGNSSLNNCIVLMTTNHIDKIDNALIRSGRVDHKIEIAYPSKEDIEHFILEFYGKQITLSDLDKTKTMSDIQTIALCNNLDNFLKEIEINNKVIAVKV